MNPPSIAVTQSLNVIDIANLAVALAIIIAGSLSVFYIFVGGISFILSGGQEEKIKQSVNTIRYAIIGLVVTIFSVTIIKILGLIFDFDLLSFISWDRITVLMNNIVEKVIKGGGGSGGSLDGGGVGGGNTLR